MKKIYASLFLLIIVFFNSKQVCAEQSKVESQYAFLDDVDIYILLKKTPCSLTENQLIGLKTELLALRNNSKISRNKKIHSIEKINSTYGHLVDIKNLKTCTIESLTKPNQKLDKEDAPVTSSFW